MKKTKQIAAPLKSSLREDLFLIIARSFYLRHCGEPFSTSLRGACKNQHRIIKSQWRRSNLHVTSLLQTCTMNIA